MLLKIGNTVINSDQVVKVDYSPLENYIDKDTNQPGTIDSSLEITLNLVEFDRPQTIYLRTTDADSAWEYFQSIAFPLF